MAVMGEVTGKAGVVEKAGVAVAIADFSIKFERGVASYARVGKYGDFNVSGKLKITGELKRMMIDGKLLADVAGASAAEIAAGAWADIGVATDFKLEGILDTTGHHITLAHCFFTGGDFHFTDADAIVEETFPFIVRDPDVDVSGNYSV